MITILLRTIIVYLLLLLTMRLLGKRQLGELEVSELITTILLSEIASIPISNQDVPLSFAIIPLIAIVTFEVTVSFLSSKFTKLQNLFSPSPSTLIYKGRINQKELCKNRISPEELISELRLKSITDPSLVEYAILEQNVMLSIIPKTSQQQVTLEHLGIVGYDNGIVHIIISQGVWNEHNLKLLNKKQREFEDYLKQKRLTYKEVFLLTIDDAGNKNLVVRENSK